MGSYFANLYVKQRSPKDIEKKITEYYANLGVTPTDAENADIKVSIFAPYGSEWVSVCSEAFTHDDILALAPSISKVTQNDVLSAACFDSDYLFLNLINEKDSTDAWINIGKSYEIKAPRRSNVAAWKNKVSDFDSFKLAAKEKYICAEEFLFSVCKNLGISPNQIDGFELPEDSIKLCFSAPVKSDAEPAKFTVPSYSLTPCRIGIHDACAFYNTGGASRGIAVAFTGNYVENDEITFENTAIRTTKGSLNEFTSCPITLQKIRLSDGRAAYYWEDKSFKIPECVSDDLPPMVYQKKKWTRQITVDFVPQGNPRKVLDIAVTMIPLSNPIDGQYTWCVWHYHGSKRELIEQHNASEKELAENWGKDPEYYNPDDYDLD